MFRSRSSAIAAVLAAVAITLAAANGTAQQIAFPGAEGADRFATGGRGADVYFVTKLT